MLEILKLAWPLIVANSFWNLQMTIDRLYLGALSTDSLGAAVAVMGVFWVPMALLQQTASYITTFVAQYYGAKETNKIGSAIWQSIYVSSLGGLCFLALIYFSASFFAVVGHSLRLQDLEIQYFDAMTLSALPTALVAIASGFFTGIGDSKKVMQINFVGLIFNILLDYVMIFGRWGIPALGIAGAGYATALATWMAAGYGFYLVWKADLNGEYCFLSAFKLKFSLMTQFLKFGLPSGLQWALEGLAFTVFLIVVGRLSNGDVALASSSIAVSIMMLAVLPSMGVAQAVMSQVGQALGDKNPVRAQTMTWNGVKLTFFYIIMIAISFYLVPNFYTNWFKNTDNQIFWDQVSIITPQILRIVAIFVVFDSIYLNISFALKGAGDTRFVSIVALLLPWPIMVLPTYLASDWPNGVIWAWGFVAIYGFVISSILFLRFQSGKWKSLSVIS